MPLKGKKPESVQKRFKALFFGTAGAGKTTAAIQFPKPYLIDTEKGAENESYTRILREREGLIFQTQDYEEVIQEIKTLATEKHPYKTLIIDPLTTIYNNLLDHYEQKNGADFGRHYNAAAKDFKRLFNWLLRLDMNVIITCHAKNEYGSKMNVLGQVFDCYKKLDYLFDLVIEIRRQGKSRVGFITKSRIEEFKEEELFEFSYDSISKRYKNGELEKSVSAVVTASKEQISQLKEYIELFKISEEVIEKWLSKAQCSSFEEMDTDKIQKCIDALKEKIK